MANEDRLEETVEPLGPVEPVEEPVAAEEDLATTVMTHTVDEIPELTNRAVGDLVTFRVVNVSEDGKAYDMEISEEPAEIPPTPAPPVGGGRSAVAEALI